MRQIIREHPVVSWIFGVGWPGWVGFAAAGWPLALVVALFAVLALLVWRP